VGKLVEEISCGGMYTLARTQDGKVHFCKNVFADTDGVRIAVSEHMM